jgi:hypothetical protein
VGTQNAACTFFFTDSTLSALSSSIPRTLPAFTKTKPMILKIAHIGNFFNSEACPAVKAVQSQHLKQPMMSCLNKWSLSPPGLLHHHCTTTDLTSNTMLASSIEEDLHYSGFVTDLITGYHETSVILLNFDDLRHGFGGYLLKPTNMQCRSITSQRSSKAYLCQSAQRYDDAQPVACT